MSPLDSDDKLDHALGTLAAVSPVLSSARHAAIVGRILAPPNRPTPAVESSDGDADLIGVVSIRPEPPPSRTRVIAGIGIGLAAAAGLALWLSRPAADIAPRQAAEPVSLTPQQLEADRLTGEKNIVPDDETRDQIAAGPGKVVGSFKLCLDLGGHVSSTEILKSTGFPAYDDEIIAGIEQWTYKPQQQLVCTAVTFIYSVE